MPFLSLLTTHRSGRARQKSYPLPGPLDLLLLHSALPVAAGGVSIDAVGGVPLAFLLAPACVCACVSTVTGQARPALQSTHFLIHIETQYPHHQNYFPRGRHLHMSFFCRELLFSLDSTISLLLSTTTLIK